jgi:MFS family permease
MFIIENPNTRFLTIAGILRKFSDMIITCYLPIFFMKNYPKYKTEYALFGAVILAILGFISNLLTGLIGDRFENKNPMVKGWICTMSAISSCLLTVLACSGHGNFWLTMFAVSMHILISGGFSTTTITMI